MFSKSNFLDSYFYPGRAGKEVNDPEGLKKKSIPKLIHSFEVQRGLGRKWRSTKKYIS